MLRVAQQEVPSDSSMDSSAAIWQSTLLQAPSATITAIITSPHAIPVIYNASSTQPAAVSASLQPSIASAIVNPAPTTPTKMRPYISVVVSTNKKDEEDVAELPEQDPETDLLRQLDVREPVMPPSPGIKLEHFIHHNLPS